MARNTQHNRTARKLAQNGRLHSTYHERLHREAVERRKFDAGETVPGFLYIVGLCVLGFIAFAAGGGF